MQASVLLRAQDRCQEGEERDLNVRVQLVVDRVKVLELHLLVAGDVSETGESRQPDQGNPASH